MSRERGTVGGWVMVVEAGAATIAELEERAARLVARLGAGEIAALLRLRSLPRYRRAGDAVLREAATGADDG